MINRICVFCNGYPTDSQPIYSFIETLLVEFGRKGVSCTVIAPQPIPKNLLHKSYLREKKWIRTVGEVQIKIYQPYYTSLSKIGSRGLNQQCFEHVAETTFNKLYENGERFDIVYGHFWSCGLLAAKIGKAYQIPSFVANGESQIDFKRLKKNSIYKESVLGVISVSSKSKQETMSLGLAKESQITVLPNAIDSDLFYPMDKRAARKELGIDPALFVICFVGGFIERKGSLRVSQALDQLEDVYSFFIGTGKCVPDCKNRLYTGVVPHERIPVFLSAADVFVLPTLNEGCCNAVIEALSCGCPVISSDCAFNFDILDETCSILINPNSVEAIRTAIDKMRNDGQYRGRLAEGMPCCFP